MKKKDEIFSISSLLMASFLYGFFPILTRTIGFKMPIFFQNWTRSLFEIIIFIFPVIIFRKWVRIKVNDYGWLILRTLGGAIGFLGAYYAFIYLPIGTAYFIFFAGSLIGGFVLGKLLFKEKITRLKLAALLMALAGLLFIYSFSLKANQLVYVLSAVSSGLGTALWNVSSKKISHKYSALQINFIDELLYGLLIFLISVIIREPWSYPNLGIIWIANFLFAVIFIINGQLIIYGFKNIEGQVGSLIMMMEVVFGITLGLIFYKEILSIKAMIGGSLIILALIISQLKIKNRFLS